MLHLGGRWCWGLEAGGKGKCVGKGAFTTTHTPVPFSLACCRLFAFMPNFFFQARLLEETRRFGNVLLKLNVTSARHERSCRLRQGGHRSLGGLMEAGVRTGSSHLSLPSFSLTKSRGRWEEEHCLSGDVVSYRPLRAQLSLGRGVLHAVNTSVKL